MPLTFGGNHVSNHESNQRHGCVGKPDHDPMDGSRPTTIGIRLRICATVERYRQYVDERRGVGKAHQGGHWPSEPCTSPPMRRVVWTEDAHGAGVALKFPKPLVATMATY